MAGDGLYLEAAQILRQVCEGKGVIRTLCYGSRIQNKKALFALVCESARHVHLLRRVLEASDWLVLANRTRRQLPASVKRVEESLAIVLLHDFLLSQQLRCGAELKCLVEGSRARLRAELVRAQLQFKREGRPMGVISDAEESEVPRYVRINRCRVSEADTDSLIRQLEQTTRLSHAASPADTFHHDCHIPDLLVFPPGTDFSANPLYRKHLVILQDKASCFPPVVLSPPVGTHVIDACAAPGNKTTQLCAAVGPTGHVWAFERDPRRYETLCRLTSAAVTGCDPRVGSAAVTGCDSRVGSTAVTGADSRVGSATVTIPAATSSTTGNLSALLADFLTVNPDDPRFARVEYILCDPSCSGSGMPMSLERSLTSSQSSTTDESRRLDQLGNFQSMIVKHAMQFPAVKRVVYSTCSLHARENEQVVAEVLRDCVDFELVSDILPNWPRRGLREFPFWKDVVRADARLDRMNGFFVALFQRKASQ